MNKKLQVFISSTYMDLQDERQAAVEAVLTAGHIPAGMELFRPGDESQKETIKRWIDESDVYVLILGGRYGSIEPFTNKSYSHWEYDYAGEINIPRFAIVISEKALENKVKEQGPNIMERNNTEKLNEFRSQVLSKTSVFFDDIKDIKLSVITKLSDLAKDDSLSGWVRAKELEQFDRIKTEVLDYAKENRILREQLESLHKQNKLLAEQTSHFISSKVDFGDRVENILDMLQATYLSKNQAIGWEIGEEDDEEEKLQSIVIPYPEDPFSAYFIYSEDGSIIEKLMIIAIVESDEYGLQELIAKIRKSVRLYRKAIGVPIKFIIAVPGSHGELQERIDEYVKSVLKNEKVEDPGIFGVEVWDDNVLEFFEDQLELTIKT